MARLGPEGISELEQLKLERKRRQEQARVIPEMQQTTTIPAPPIEPTEAEELEALLFEKRKREQIKRTPKIEAAKVGVQTLGLPLVRPYTAGLGAAAGGFVGRIEAGAPISEAYEFSKEEFTRAKNEAIEEEDKAAREQPGAFLGGQLVGGGLTAKFLPVRGLAGAAGLGAGIGVGRAIERAKTPGEAAEEIAFGAGAGAATFGLIKGAGQVVRGAKFLFRKASKAASKIAEALTGIPQSQIDDYAARIKEINNLIKQVGGDFQEATDQAREKILLDMRNFRQNTSNKITTTLDNASPEKIVDAKAITEKLEAVRDKLDDILQADDIKDINEILGFINRRAGESGKLSLGETFKVKELLYNRSKGSFLKDGKIFVSKDNTKRAAQAGRKAAKDILDELSPDIAEANKRLHQLHLLEEKMNVSLLKSGKPISTFLQGGAGLNKRNEAALKRIGELTGTDALDQAKKLSTARTFSEVKLLPTDLTGKSLTRLAVGGALGGVISGISGFDESKGIMIGAALTSPLALKTAIRGGQIPRAMLKETIKFLSSPQAKSTIIRAIGSDKYRQLVDTLKEDNAINRRYRKER